MHVCKHLNGGLGWPGPDAFERAARARGRQGRCAPLTRWPEDGPPLTAAARGGSDFAQVGTEEWPPWGSNKRMQLTANFMPTVSGRDK
jgi:hypothetical protein